MEPLIHRKYAKAFQNFHKISGPGLLKYYYEFD